MMSETLFSARSNNPGEHLCVDFESIEVTVVRYWQPQTDPALSCLDDREAIERFRSPLMDRLKCECVAMFLSAPVFRWIGPVALFASIAKFSVKRPVSCIYWSLSWTSAMNGHTPKRSSSLPMSRPSCRTAAGNLLDDLPDFMWYNELPVGSSSQFAQWCVFGGRTERRNGFARRTGCGRTLAGYEQYFRSLTALHASGTMIGRKSLRSSPDTRRRFLLPSNPGV